VSKTTRELDDLEQKTLALALKDQGFRERLLADPKAAIAEVTGLALPESTRVKVIEREPDTLYLILPAQGAPGELSEAELGKVTGGTGALADIDTGQKKAVDL
jgi:Nitrile hydratase, alpha chain